MLLQYYRHMYASHPLILDAFRLPLMLLFTCDQFGFQASNVGIYVIAR
jgi:hypothetical protein